jgi:hypothetical protein
MDLLAGKGLGRIDHPEKSGRDNQLPRRCGETEVFRPAEIQPAQQAQRHDEWASMSLERRAGVEGAVGTYFDNVA